MRAKKAVKLYKVTFYTVRSTALGVREETDKLTQGYKFNNVYLDFLEQTSEALKRCAETIRLLKDVVLSNISVCVQRTDPGLPIFWLE